jgi:hypothetical protein
MKKPAATTITMIILLLLPLLSLVIATASATVALAQQAPPRDTRIIDTETIEDQE